MIMKSKSAGHEGTDELRPSSYWNDPSIACMIGTENMNRELIRSLKFVLFSASAGIIQIISFTLMNELTGLPYWPCYLTALILSVLWNFTLNRRYTFRSAASVPKAMILVGIFYAAFTPLSTIAGNYLAESAGVNEYAVTILNMLSNFVLEYLYDRFIVFRRSLDTRD